MVPDELNTWIAVGSAAVSIVVSLLGGISAWLMARANFQKIQTERDAQSRQAGLSTIEASRQLNAASAELVGSAAQRLRECDERERKAITENRRYRMSLISIAGQVIQMSERIRDLADKHEETAKATDTVGCPGFPMMQVYILSLADEIERFARTVRTEVEQMNGITLPEEKGKVQ